MIGTAPKRGGAVCADAAGEWGATVCVIDVAREECETGPVGAMGGVFGAADAGGSDEAACADRPNETAGGSACVDVGDTVSSGETNCADTEASGAVGMDARGCGRVADPKNGACEAKISTRRSSNSKLCIAEPLKVIKI